MRATTTTWLLAVAALAGCGDIIGLGDYTDAVDGGSDATADAKSDAGSDAKADAPGDASPDAPTCGASSVCVPTLPAGWSWAVYAPDTRPPCSTGYATPADVEEGLDASAATCGCSCTTNAPSCATGNLAVTRGNNNSCDNFNPVTAPADAGTCGTSFTAFSTGGGVKISVTGPAPTGGSCTPTPAQTIAPVAYDHQGRTCAFAGDGGGACGNGSVCMPDPAPFGVCVSQPGQNPCPAGFPTQHLVGTSVTDTRGCTACGCTFDAGACNGTATFYTNSSCSQGGAAVPADGTCTNVGNHTFSSYTYAATTTASCAPSAVSPDGGAAFADETTVCCK